MAAAAQGGTSITIDLHDSVEVAYEEDFELDSRGNAVVSGSFFSGNPMPNLGYLQRIQRPAAVTSRQAEQVNSAVGTPVAAASSRHKVRAQFGRRRTHNEQIIVAPCGVIIARATFYGAEAVSSVAVRSS